MNHLPAVVFSLAAALAPASAPADWRLVWSDEFDGSGLPDPEKWTYEQGFVRNREAQYYMAGRQENSTVKDGVLVLTARQERLPNPDFREGASESDRKRGQQFLEYTSASLTTRSKANWRGGRIEVRAQLPTGRGMWPAIWMLGEKPGVGWPACGEIDIMENVGYEPNVIHANVHTAKYNHVQGNNKGAKITIERPCDDFHVYAIEWDQRKIDFFVDEQKYFTYENEGSGPDAWPFENPHYLILNIAIGGSWGGQRGIDDSIFPQTMTVDYVRVYEREPA